MILIILLSRSWDRGCNLELEKVCDIILKKDRESKTESQNRLYTWCSQNEPILIIHVQNNNQQNKNYQLQLWIAYAHRMSTIHLAFAFYQIKDEIFFLLALNSIKKAVDIRYTLEFTRWFQRNNNVQGKRYVYREKIYLFVQAQWVLFLVKIKN